MSDSTPDLPQIESSQSGKETTANRNINMGLTMFGIVKIVGFVVSYAGGRLNGTHVNAGTVTLGASATYYVVAHKSTLAVTAATSTTNWDDDTTYGRIAKVVMGASTYTSWEDHRFGSDGIFPMSGGGSSFTGGTLTTALNEAPITTLASASTTNVGAQDVNTISISGTTTITAFDTIASGAVRRLVFQGALTLTHNGSSLILPTAANITTAAGDVATFVSLGSGNWRCVGYQRESGYAVRLPFRFTVAISDETTDITTGTAKTTFRWPYPNSTLTAVRASLSITSSSGNPTFDINEGGTTILSTKLSIDASEKTSTTAATPAVISDASIADDAEITIDVDIAGTGAKGAKVMFIGYYTP
ncbi:MAG: hypothetical protein IT516_12485 [Burkholderiales bacterium]|nr:hypothetical protein [Burkholderiales bacterium]